MSTGIFFPIIFVFLIYICMIFLLFTCMKIAELLAESTKKDINQK